MYHTWFFQKRLAEELKKKLTGLILVECFSQQKDELILSFADSETEFHIKADLGAQSGILSFQESFARARKNSVDLFRSLVDQKVREVSDFNFERSFQIHFEKGEQLIFKMHGSRSNILRTGDQVEEIFRGNLKRDWDLIPSQLARAGEMTQELFVQLVGKKNLRLLPSDLSEFTDMLPQMMHGMMQVGLDNGQPVLSFFSIEDTSFATRSALEASNKFAELHYRYGSLAQEKQRVFSQIQKRIKQADSYIKKTSGKLSEVISARNPEEIGHLIMANLHRIKEGEERVELEDLYGSGTLEVKMSPRLSPQKNAETYYRKSKNRKIEIGKLEENLNNKKRQIQDLQEDLETLAGIDDIRELKKFGARFFQKEVSNSSANKPYHEFLIEGWQILVGKNAKANDDLTQRVAKKNDLWLHAKDVSGSHVVIRERPGSNFPGHIIERAAALAAYYSKRKTDSLCPVIYTPKKYVRKVKGAPAGQVMVDREQVVMVEPNSSL